MRILGIAAAFAALIGSAQAAVITYDLTFYAVIDPNNTEVFAGTGTLTFDPAVTFDLWVDNVSGPGDPCAPDPLDPFCTFHGTYTPISVQYGILGAQGGIRGFLEGTYKFQKSLGYVWEPGKWDGFDLMGEGVIIDAIFGPGRTFWTSCCFSTPALTLAGWSGSGYVDVTPVPLPAAVWLFVAGLGGLGLRARRRAAPAADAARPASSRADARNAAGRALSP